MFRSLSLLLLAVAPLFALFAPVADAQARFRSRNPHGASHGRNLHASPRVHATPRHATPRVHVDHRNSPIRDSGGHVVGNLHRDVIHRDARYVVPHVQNSLHHGTYHFRGGSYYYTPQTVVARARAVRRPVVVAFGGFSRIDDLAARLETLANEFCLDLHYNYRHNPGFQETYGEAYQILGAAKYVHAAEHQQNREAVRARLSGLDALMHHVQGDVRGWSRHHYRQIGQLGIIAKMEMIESTLHHLMNSVGVHPTAAGEQAPVPGGGAEQAPAPLSLAPSPMLSAPASGPVPRLAPTSAQPSGGSWNAPPASAPVPSLAPTPRQ